MDRIEVPFQHDMAVWLAAVERGDEVVIVRDGTEVARVDVPKRKGSLDPARIAWAQEQFKHLRVEDESGAQLIRRLRDESDH